MTIEICAHERAHRLGERATHPIEPRCGALAALLLLAGLADVARLIRVLHRLVQGGHASGRVVVQGRPEAVVASGSHTGAALRPVLSRDRAGA